MNGSATLPTPPRGARPPPPVRSFSPISFHSFISEEESQHSTKPLTTPSTRIICSRYVHSSCASKFFKDSSSPTTVSPFFYLPQMLSVDPDQLSFAPFYFQRTNFISYSKTKNISTALSPSNKATTVIILILKL